MKRLKCEVNLNVAIDWKDIPDELQEELYELITEKVADYYVDKLNKEDKKDEITDEEIQKRLDKVFEETVDTLIPWISNKMLDKMKPLYIKSIREWLNEWKTLDELMSTMIDAIIFTNKQFKK